jgi:hypothetical protein
MRVDAEIATQGMKKYFFFECLIIAAAAVIIMVSIKEKLQAQNANSGPMDTTGGMIATGNGAETNNQRVSPIYGVTIPAGYRDWKLIAVNQLVVAGKTDQLRAQFGNDTAIKAFKEGEVPFPDGSIIAAIHWTRVPSEDNNKVLDDAFPGAESFVVGSAVNVQFMVKDSKKYAATGGWGFADFKNGKPGSKVLHETCFACHEPAKSHDFVFTHYAP